MAWASALRQAAYAVAVCGGPGDDQRCPLAEADECAAASGADVIVSSLDWGQPRARAVRRDLRRCHASVPLIIETTPPERRDWPEGLEGSVLLDAPASPERLVTVVEQTLACRPRAQA